MNIVYGAYNNNPCLYFISADTIILLFLLEAAKLNFPTNEKNDLQVAWSVKEWLKHSGTRIHGQNKSTQK